MRSEDIREVLHISTITNRISEYINKCHKHSKVVVENVIP
jgi:hypothetical protein